jgi:3,4-dihydroxy 2-butanone 4-phosphate synthase / GTP cyclohydrolase II
MKQTAESRVLRRVATARFPAKWGEFQALGSGREFATIFDGLRVRSRLCWGEVAGNVPLWRIRSQCLTGDALGSLRCDCGEQQLELARRAIARERCGLLLRSCRIQALAAFAFSRTVPRNLAS